MDGLDGWGHVLSLGGLGAMWSASRGEEGDDVVGFWIG